MRLGDGHLQHVGDALAPEHDLQRVLVVAPAVAHLARHGHVRQELHLYLHVAVARARLAAPALHVEGEASGHVAARLRLRQGGEQLPYGGERAGVGGRVAAGRPADGRLVDVDDLVHVVQAVDAVARAGAVLGAVEALRQPFVEHLVDQRGLAGAGDAGDADQLAEREVHVQAAQVVLPRVLHAQPLAVPLAPRER